MKVVVGLGNPGRQYRHTRHNVGFAVMDELASGLSAVLRRSLRFRARVGKAVLDDEELLLVKPQTYMNRSGVAVAAVLRRRRLSPSDMVVVLDDADLDIGTVRIRARGSSGGHKGLGSVVEAVGSEEFARVRVGIGRDSAGSELIEHVLTPFSSEEEREMRQVIKFAAEAVLCIVEFGADAAMNKFNGRWLLKPD